VLSRLKDPENSSIFSKMLVYDGENLKDTDPKAKSLHEYVDYAGVDEGMNGLSTRFAFKILSKVFNFDNTEVAANPVHLLYVLEQQIEREQFPPETEQRYLSYIKEHLAQRYVDFIGKEIQTAYLESYSEYGQNIFDPTLRSPTSGSRTRSSATRTPANRSTANRSMPNSRRSRSRPASRTRRTSATRSSTSACGRARPTAARIRHGRVTRSSARSSRRRCSRIPRNCCR
jgi:serine protein kinase